jgi:hypothetical protein
MRRIVDGTAYDTETSELIVQVGNTDHAPENVGRLYRTRNGAFFLWAQFLTPGYNVAQEITPLTDDEAQKWLETNANHLVEQYFGTMPEGGAAERRMTLRLPQNLASKLEAIAQSREMPLSRYITRCLERCAADDGKPTPII